jgi:ribosomal-protein-alanine N-acetyltransferase
MNLRKANKADLKTVISWIPDEILCKRWAGPKVRFPLNVENLLEDIAFADKNAYCLKSKRSIVAFGQLLVKENGYLHLARIIVDPSKRAMGYGRRLCEELIKMAGSKGCQKLSLNVYWDNTIALKLYESLGFRENAEKSSEEYCQMVKL